MTHSVYRTASFLLVFGLFSGCASIPPGTIIFHDKYNSVRLESIRGEGDSPPDIRFDHPAEFTEEEMAALLGSVQVVRPPGFLSRVLFKNRALPEPAFNEKEIGRFAPVFVEAFMKAGPEERVVFFFHHQRKIYKGTTSSGVAFIKNGQFNLIFGRFLKGNEPGKPDIDIRGKPIPSIQDQDFYLYPGDHQNLITDKRFPVTREVIFPKRWLTIDSAALFKSPPQKTRETSLEKASENTSGKRSPSPPKTTEETLEGKLQILKTLYDKELITEEEYSQKRRDLLSDF